MLSIIAFFAVVYGLLLSILAFKVKGLAPASSLSCSTFGA
jgi:hypothetical protein